MSETPTSLKARITAAPIAYDPHCAEDLGAKLPGDLNSGAMAELLAGAAGSAPYLANLIRRHGEWLSGVAETPPEDAMAAILAEMAAAVAEAGDQRSAAEALRLAKSRAALLIALADLGGVWDLSEVTGALTGLADAATSAGAKWCLAEAIRRKMLPGLAPEDVEGGAGYIVIGMGKHGARELNYSSDIDLICLFDQDRFDPGDLAEAKAGYIRATRRLVQLLADQTAQGYVFRTDLRLRPAPSTTPVCLAMETAERYYESVGRTWERAAHIKARPVAGDLAEGQGYLDRLTPFVWRRYLDFAAIEDTHDMLRKIREKKGRFTPAVLPGHDIKLGPGGIREIEFFAQTRQLISGGRDARLRVPATLGALDALVETGWAERETADVLAADYVAHRTLEHRLQMIEDAQTQTIPTAEEARARVAALCGWGDRRAWEQDIASRLARVHGACEAFFTPGSETGGTGAPKEAGTEDLAALGFTRPEDATRLLDRWRSGQIPATRTSRARHLYRGLEPKILRLLGGASSPDESIAEFDRFLSGLPTGVQVFSLFTANPHLLDLIVEICTVAPKLAAHLGKEPQTLDALLSGEFFHPLPAADALWEGLETWIGAEDDYERVLDSVRRWAREQKFRVGVQVLRGLAEENEAGAGFSAIAEACLGALLPRVIAEFSRRHGPPPGNGLAVIAMGKLGSNEMTAGSDLDLIIVYDPGDAEESTGPKPLAPITYYPRLTQAFVAALTVPTAEGRLYEVDMRLRPSGRQGPVATSITSFEAYQREKAWVWEHLALTRARVICGAAPVRAAVETVIADALSARAAQPEILGDVQEMRAKLAEAHAAERGNIWSFKQAAGGLMEIEYLAQSGVLLNGIPNCRNAGTALPLLAERGWLSAREAEALGAALTLMRRLQQVERVALETPFDPETAGKSLRRVMARTGGAETFAGLAAELERLLAVAAEIVSERLR